MEATFLSKVVLPASLFIVMLGMGLSLERADFRRVLAFPKAVAVGVLLQMVALPILGLLVVKLFGMSGALAVGLMVLALSPGGVTSNMISFLARGDVALSVTLTAIVSLVTPFTLPLILAPVMDDLMGSSQAVALPVKETIIQLLAITVVPIFLGMVIRRFAPGAAARSEKPVKIFSIVILAVIIAGIIKQNSDRILDFFAQVGLSTLALNLLAMAAGFVGARVAGLGRRQGITIGVEVGIQNGTTALLVTSTILGDKVMSIAPAIYSLVMFGTGGVFAYLASRRGDDGDA
ncbi:MAG: bile acid:sodium symporter family protein [Myxococcales bacterium]|nr:bile acid:sodium symporter family protein [Myxococcales bacterium]MCB9570036.1 bile acid:sodium symporter family protein [Myxococcales bacterium]MCB9701866.1 bile acid:sodium symporter family protein [Myxococcales bacterium]